MKLSNAVSKHTICLIALASILPLLGCQLPNASEIRFAPSTETEVATSDGNSNDESLAAEVAAQPEESVDVESSAEISSTATVELLADEEFAAAQAVPAPVSLPTLTSINEAEWSSNGQWIALSGSINESQGALEVYSPNDLFSYAWQAPSPLASGPQSLVISPDDQRIAAITSSNMVTIWDINNGSIIANLSYNEFTSLTSVAFSPAGDRIAIGGAVGTSGLVKVIDLATQVELSNIPYEQPFMNLSFHPNGKNLSGSVSHSCGPGAAYAFTLDLDGDLADFDWRRDVEIQHPQQGESSKSKMLTVGAYGQRCQFYIGDIQMVETETKAITGNVVRLAALPRAYLSADGSAFVVDDGNRMEVWRDAPLRRVRVLDPAAGKPLAISPDGALVAQANGNVITFVGTGGAASPAVAIDADAPIQIVEDFAPLDPTTVEARYQRMEIPDGLLSITKASQNDPAILTFVVDQAAIDKYLMAVHNFDTIQDWSGARYIEVDVRNGSEQAPLMIQLRERHPDGRQGDSWRGSRAVPPFSEMTVSILLEAGKGFNPIRSAPAGDGVLDLDAIGTIELGVTSHHIMRGQMEILSIRLFE